MNEKFIPLSVPNLKGNELKYVTAAIESEWVSTGGPYITEFETQISHYVNTKGAVSCQSGTAGLHIALLLTEVKSTDIVIVPTLTFIAAVNPVKYIGASPIFMDCDDSLCMDPIKLKKFCKEECETINGRLLEKQSKKHVKALIVVHVFGNMADMESILEIAAQYNIKIIEDATEALGTYYTEGKHSGKFAGTLGDIGVYSFNGNKIITTGGGGMLVSNDEAYLKEARHLTTQAKSDELYYTHDMVGYNYRMTNLQAALGLAQLEQLEKFIQVKEENYQIYEEHFNNIEQLTLLSFRKDIRSNKWFYAILCREDYHMNRDETIGYLLEYNIQSRPIWGLISDQVPYIEDRTYHLEKAPYYWKHVVNVPCSTNLEISDVHRVCNILKRNR